MMPSELPNNRTVDIGHIDDNSALALHAADILNSITDAFVTLDHVWRFTYVNDQAVRLLAKPRSELLGHIIWDVFPDIVGTISDQECHRALREQISVSFEQFYPPLNACFEVRAYPFQDGISLFFQNTTERVLRRERERFLSDLADRAMRLTDPDAVIADAVEATGRFLGVSRCAFADIDVTGDICTVPRDYCSDPSIKSIVGSFPISAFGEYLCHELLAGRTVAVSDVHLERECVPSESVAAYDAIDCRAFITVPVLHSARLVSVISVHSAVPRQWTPEEIQLVQAIVERTWLIVEVSRQQQQMARILETVTDGFFVVDRHWRFSYVNAQAERMLFRKREDLLGRSIWEEFPEAVGGTFYDLYNRAMENGIPVTVEDYYAPLDAWMDVRVYPSEAGLSVFFQNVGERKRAEAERERMLAEQKSRAEREAILNRIALAIRAASEPEAVYEAAINLVSEALGSDRCYFALYDLGRGIVNIVRDVHRADLPSVQGTYAFPNTVSMFRELYHGLASSVIEDSETAAISPQTKANMDRLRLRSRISVALREGEDMMGTLTAAMSDTPRAWASWEVTLMEAVATQLRASAEMVRVAQRERNIAQQLQTALQPDLPGTLPGLAVDKYYRAALAEASVGGDFFDVYAIEKGCTALVVGDLSGKGLAAASQVAVVRNMLRAFMYSRASIAEAVNELNRVLVENNLLTGFTTLFVGAFDAATRRLKYVNCGQEPALLRRTGSLPVEFLHPTGPILGAMETARYTEDTVDLGVGDVFAIFTDGLTEIGPRRELLGISGVVDLLTNAPIDQTSLTAVETAAEVVKHLIRGVDEYGLMGARDDMCLLVGMCV